MPLAFTTVPYGGGRARRWRGGAGGCKKMGEVFNWTHMESIRAGGFAGGRPRGGWRRGNHGASAAARIPARCGPELGHGWSWELRWGLRKKLKCLGSPESKRKGRFTAAALMATAADSCALGRAQGRNKGGFIGHQRCEAVLPELRGLQEQWHGHGGGWQRAAGFRPLAEGGARVCAAAAWHQPRGGRRVTPRRHTCSRSPALDRRPRACSIMRTRRYGGEADVACRGTMSRGLTRLKNNSKCTNI
jgi:hypothetical protein